jgi:hypothetical protein
VPDCYTASHGRWPGRGEVLHHVQRVAAQRDRKAPYREQVNELLLLATEREAVVAQAYMGTAIQRRLTQLRKKQPTKVAIVDLLNEIIQYVWSQEEGHTSELKSLSTIGGNRYASWRTAVFGRVQGWLTQAAAGNQPVRHAIAQGIIDISIKTKLAPSFARALHGLTHREFFDLKVELEEAAVLGYEQISAVLHECFKKTGKVPINIGLQNTVGRIFMDEVRHRELFRLGWNWLTPGNRLRAELTIDECTREVQNVFEDHPQWPADVEARYAAADGEFLIDQHTTDFLRRIGVNAKSARTPALNAAARALLLADA